MKMTEFGVIWDLDGVIVDTGEAHYKAWVEAFSEVGLTLTEEQYSSYFGMNNAGIIQNMMGERADAATIEAVSERKEVQFRSLVRGNVRLIPGVEGWIRAFRESGAPQAIATSTPMENVDVIMAELGMEAQFEAIVSGDGMASKPDPAVFLAAAERIEQAAERCLVVEDAVAGVEGAKRAGMRCIAITTTNAAERLGRADFIVAAFGAVPWEVLEGWFGE